MSIRIFNPLRIGTDLINIENDTTFRVGPTRQFTLPTDFANYIQRFRIMPGVSVQCIIDSGIYTMDEPVIGHIDGSRLSYINSGVNGVAFSCHSATVLASSGDGTTATLTTRGSFRYTIGQTIKVTGNGAYNTSAATVTDTSFDGLTWLSTVSYLSSATGSVTGGTITADFATLDAIWDFDLVNGGVTQASIDAANAVAEPIVRGKYNVIFEFTTGVAMLACNNMHSGVWTDAPCLWINTGNCDSGVTTGVGNGELLEGPGGIACVGGSTFYGPANSCAYTDGGGTINADNALFMFPGQSGIRMDFGGAVQAQNIAIIGCPEYGCRGNHAGATYMEHIYIRGCSAGAASTNTTSMFRMNNGDIEYCYIGARLDFGGSGLLFSSSVKNNAFSQIVLGAGYMDMRDTDCATTATFGGSPPLYGIQCNDADSSVGLTGSFNSAIVTGHNTDLYLANVGSIKIEISGPMATQYDTAKSYRTVIFPDALGNLLPPPGPPFDADTGSTDDYAITIDSLNDEWGDGFELNFRAKTANTGAATLAVNGTAAKAIRKGVNTVLANNDILAQMYCKVVWDKTNDFWVLMNPRSL